MSQKHRHEEKVHRSKSREWLRDHAADSSAQKKHPALEIVLKCDSDGSMEAVCNALAGMQHSPDVGLSIIHRGIGDIHKSDIELAETGSRLIVGFQTGVEAGLEKLLIERGVEVRLYPIIYRLTEDVAAIVKSLIPHAPDERVTGSARVIALFKSSRKGIIIGCKVLDGHLSVGQHFRVISAVGPVYAGLVESMKIEKTLVQKALPGQQVGIKIRDFRRVRVGDIVESYKTAPSRDLRRWIPRSGIFRID